MPQLCRRSHQTIVMRTAEDPDSCAVGSSRERPRISIMSRPRLWTNKYEDDM